MPTSPTSFRLKENELEQLKLIAEYVGGGRLDALKFALQAGIDAIQGKKEEPNPDRKDETDWKAMYMAEKERNEAMSGKLMELSDKVADSLQAAQMLHGADKAEHAALENAEQKEERLSRWQRLKRAWRG